jgi:hypothetical protein
MFISDLGFVLYDPYIDVSALLTSVFFPHYCKVDERAVLKHFDWPEKKADTLREAAFGYCDLKKLENEVSNYEDDPHLPRDIALKKMVSISEK